MAEPMWQETGSWTEGDYGWARTDGTQVVEMSDAWVVALHGSARPRMVIACPCCGAVMRTAKAAKLVADAYWPVAS